MRKLTCFFAVLIFIQNISSYTQTNINKKTSDKNDTDWTKVVSETSNWKVTEINIIYDYTSQEINEKTIETKNTEIIESCKEFINDWKTWKNKTKYNIYIVSFDGEYNVFEIKPGKKVSESLERDLVFGKNFLFFSQNPEQNIEPGKSYILEKKPR